MKIWIVPVLLVVAACWQSTADAQMFHITECNAPVTIGNHLLSAREASGHDFFANNLIKATEKEVLIGFRFNGNTGYVNLPYGKQVSIARVQNSQYTTLDPHDNYFAFVFDLIAYFRNKGETVKDYQHRLAEVLGVSRGAESNPMESPLNKRILKNYDQQALRRIADTLTARRISDSTVYYLKYAIFLEQNHYFGFALDYYDKAYRFQKNSGQPSATVQTVYQQFLYRMGKTAEGNNLAN